MLLAIDSGNTNTVFAVFDDNGKIMGEWRSSTNANRTADEFAVWLSQLMSFENLKPADINSAIIATVVPAMLFGLKTLCRKYFKVDPLIVGDENVDLGIKVFLDRPEEVGADRLVNAIAAHEMFTGPMIIIDFGTATTFDVVDKDGNYCGGAIAPGINLSLEALHMAAAKLPRVAIGKPDKAIGKGTTTAMQSGIFWGYIGMIEGLTKRMKDEFGTHMTVIATGGLAALFAESTNVIEHNDTDLTLRGLLAIYKRNQNI
jgi:type III pantothenate kinase